MFRDLTPKDDIFDVGTIESALFGMDIEAWIERSVDMDYALECARHFSSLKDSMIDRMCERICAYHEYMLEEWNEDFVSEINEKVPCDVSGRAVLQYVEEPKLFIFPPKGAGIGYIIEGFCEWETEHGIDIVVLDDKVVYVGPPEGITPWSDESDIYCEY